MKSSFELFLALTVAALLAACRHDVPQAVHRSDGREAPLRCVACHEPEFKSTTRPPHVGARPESCGVCHTQSAWGHARIEHPWWQLTGAHARAAEDGALAGADQRVKCFWCHRGEPAQFAGTSKECIGCHAEDLQGVKFPGHDSFATTCESCHSTEAWKPATHPVAVPVPATSASAPLASASSKPALTHAPPVPKALPRPTPVTGRTPDIISHASRHH